MLFEIGSSVMNNSLAGIEASLALTLQEREDMCFGSNYYIRLIEVVT